jgi:hypothetical protein
MTNKQIKRSLEPSIANGATPRLKSIPVVVIDVPLNEDFPSNVPPDTDMNVKPVVGFFIARVATKTRLLAYNSGEGIVDPRNDENLRYGFLQ